MSLLFPRTGLDETYRTGLGFVSWNFFPDNISTQTALTSGTVYACSLPLRAGQVVTNIVLDVEVASSGTAPTGFFVGIASNAATGVMLAQSNNLSGGTFTTGLNTYALNATYTVPATGLYYVVILQNGSFSVTQPSFARGTGAGKSFGSQFVAATCGTSQTALPANASPLPSAYTITNSLAFFVGAS